MPSRILVVLESITETNSLNYEKKKKNATQPKPMGMVSINTISVAP